MFLIAAPQLVRTQALIDQAVRDGVAPAIVGGVYQLDSPRQALGLCAGEGYSLQTQFDLASLTKVLATTSLAMVLVSRGFLDLNKPVSAYLSGYRFKDIQIHHLLSHTSGLPAWRPYFELERAYFDVVYPGKPYFEISLSERLQRTREFVLATYPESEVGARAVYSDVGFILLSMVFEEVTGLPFDEAVRRWVFVPMGLFDQSGGFHFVKTDFSPLEKKSGFAPTEDCPWRKATLQGQVHDDNCWMMGGVSGHAGLFGDLESVLFFSKKLLDGWMTPDILKQFWTRVQNKVSNSPSTTFERTLGWDTVSPQGSSAGKYFSNASVGHTGFTGTALWLDPQRGLAMSLLTNRVHPTRTNDKIKAFRPLFFDTLTEELLSIGPNLVRG